MHALILALFFNIGGNTKIVEAPRGEIRISFYTPVGVPDFLNWDKGFGEADMCLKEGANPNDSIWNKTDICLDQAKDEDVVFTVAYELYVDPKLNRGYTIFLWKISTLKGKVLQWFDGKNFRVYIFVDDNWKEVFKNEKEFRAFLNMGIWINNLHNRLLHERDEGNLN